MENKVRLIDANAAAFNTHIITPELEVVDSLKETERGDGGFGSSGAF